MIWKIMRILWEYCVNLVTHSWLSVSWMNSNLYCSTGYFFCSISTWNYFPLFLWGVLYIWFYYTLWFWFYSETDTWCLLQNFLLLFPQLLRSCYTLPFSAFFKDLCICWFYTHFFDPFSFHMVLIVLPWWF